MSNAFAWGVAIGCQTTPDSTLILPLHVFFVYLFRLPRAKRRAGPWRARVGNCSRENRDQKIVFFLEKSYFENLRMFLNTLMKLKIEDFEVEMAVFLR